MIPCFIDKKYPAIFIVKIRGTSNSKPRQRRPLCDEHAAQARAAKYNVQPLDPQREEEEER